MDKSPAHPKRSMQQDLVLRATSLISLLLITFHMTHDVIFQVEGSVKYPIPVIVFVLWLYGTLMLPGRVWGYVIMFLGGLFSAAMIVVHSPGFVVGKSGGFFFAWTLFALSTTGWVTMILAVGGLWRLIRSRRSSEAA